MADIDQIDRRLGKLEGRFEKLVTDTSRSADGIAKVVGDLKTRFDRNLRDQNAVNLRGYKHITAVEKRFTKLDKSAKKLTKITDPRAQERATMRLVDQALKVFDQKRGKR